MDEQTLSSLIDLITKMQKKQDKLEEALETSFELYAEYISEIQTIILGSVEMPRDNTVEMIRLYGDPEGYFQQETFCRDFAGDWFFNYLNDEITKEELIYSIINWKVIYKNSEEA